MFDEEKIKCDHYFQTNDDLPNDEEKQKFGIFLSMIGLYRFDVFVMNSSLVSS